MTKKLVLLAAAFILFLCGLLPVLSMILGSLFLNGHLSFQAYKGILATGARWHLFANSVTLATLVCISTTMIGVPLGLLLGRTDLPLSRFFTLFFSIPLFIPPYIVAISWDQLLGPLGMFGILVSGHFMKVVHKMFFGLGGCVLVLSTIYLPIPMLLSITFSRNVNPRLEEAARLYLSWPKLLWNITTRLMVPGIFFSAILVFVLVLGEFSVPSYLRYQVFSVEGFTSFSATYDFKAATANSIPISFLAMTLLLIEPLLIGKANFYTSSKVFENRFIIVPLSGMKTLALAVVLFLGSVVILLPASGLIYASLHTGLGAYIKALFFAFNALYRSLVYSFIAATILTVCGFFSGYLLMDGTVAGYRLVDVGGLFTFALPGTVIGMGLVHLWNNTWTQWIYGTMAIIVIGYVGRYFILPTRIVLAQLRMIPRSMEEAAQIAGLGWLGRIMKIVLPLSKRALLAAWLSSFIFCLRDIDVTMLVYPPGCETLPVRIFTLMANGEPSFISALCVMMVLAVSVPVLVLWYVFSKWQLRVK